MSNNAVGEQPGGLNCHLGLQSCCSSLARLQPVGRSLEPDRCTAKRDWAETIWLCGDCCILSSTGRCWDGRQSTLGLEEAKEFYLGA